MKNFTLLKLSRAIWIALLEQEKLYEAVKNFETYKSNLVTIKTEDFHSFQEVSEELKNSQRIFEDKVLKLGNAFYERKDWSNALLCYSTIFKDNVDNMACVEKYVKCIENLEQIDLEFDLLKYIESTGNTSNDLNKLYASAYEKNKQNLQATQYYEKYLSRKDSITADDYNVLGCLYNKLYTDDTHKISDIKKSLRNFEIASEMNQNSRLFAKNATIMAGKGNDFISCGMHWDRLFEIGNLTNDDKFDYATFCLKTGNFVEWHKFFDFRFSKENNPTLFPKINKPMWNGTKNLSNSTLLVHCEQGFGDTFLMCGYLPRLAKLARHIIFVVQDSIYPLLKNNDLGVEILPLKDANLDKLKFDYYIPSMSIPTALKLTRDNISVGEGYINADKNLVEKYKKEYFNNRKFKIGISFSGSNTGNKTRDISIDKFLPLDYLDNVEIYCLTTDINDEQFEIFKNHEVINIAKSFKSFADTAAAIENLDLVITSDNCILNLSGALGKKTYGLFNWTYEFRYFDLKGDNIVWLTSVKPFVCDDIDHWEYTMNQVIKEINLCR